MGFRKVAELDDIDEGETLAVEPVAGDDPKIVLYRVGDDVFASAFFCTHEDAPMDDGWVHEDECAVECPWHAAKFCLKTGKALEAPASEPIRMYPVKVEGDDVLVDFEGAVPGAAA